MAVRTTEPAPWSIAGELAVVTVSMDIIHVDLGLMDPAVRFDLFADSTFERAEIEARLIDFLSRPNSTRFDMQTRFEQAVRQNLQEVAHEPTRRSGPKRGRSDESDPVAFEVDDFVVRNGSITMILVVVGAIRVVKDYYEILDTLNRMVRDIRRVCQDVMRTLLGAGSNVMYRSLLDVGPAVKTLPGGPNAPSTDGTPVAPPRTASRPEMITLLLLNFALTAGIIWLALKS